MADGTNDRDPSDGADTQNIEKKEPAPKKAQGKTAEDKKTGAAGRNKSSNPLVPFGNKIVINANQRLKTFDNGHVKAYDAYDKRITNKKYIALVSGVEDLPRWSSVAAYDVLAETSFMRLEGSGVIFWPMDNKEKYVFLYTAGLGDPIVEEGGFSQTSWRHPDVVSLFIQPMARIFREMSDKSFNHGSIRPSNIFHGSLNKDKPIVLGDCLSSQPSASQPNIFLPVEKALTDPMGRGGGSISDDIYAFGVSLLFFLRKNDEISQLSDEEVVRRKMEIGSYAALIGGERLPASFLEILRGTLHDDVTVRWDVDDIFSWLDGVRATPISNSKRKKANRPFHFAGKKHLFADFLALDLHENSNDIVSVVEDGSLARWINKSIDDANLQEAYGRVIDRVTNLGSVSENREYLVTQLRMALNPALPIFYKGACFTYDGLGGLLAKAVSEGESTTIYEEVLSLNIVDHALASSSSSLSQAELMSRLKLYDACRASLRQKKMGYGVAKCTYLLFKDSACMSDKLKRHFVTGAKTVVRAFEKLAQKDAGEGPYYFDSHMVAFFIISFSGIVDKCIYDIESKDTARQVQGNLRFFAFMQSREKKLRCPALAAVFSKSLAGAVKSFKNRAKRVQLIEELEKVAKAGDLEGMSALLDDEKALGLDKQGFNLAAYEYNMLQNEYNDYNKRLSHKQSYGVVNGHDAATAVSWVIATIINMFVVFAYLSGYKVF